MNADDRMTEKRTKPPAAADNGPPRPRDCGAAASGELYEIVVQGHLAGHWSEWLGDLSISHDAGGNSLLTGRVPDQAALFGILAQIRDLGLPLVSLVRITADVPMTAVRP